MSSFAPAAAPAAGHRSAAGSLASAALFFVSGMPAIVYQLIWQRSLYTLYGINIEAVTVVVAAFLLGLGIGSFAGGRISRHRSLNLLAVFGLVELVVAALGVTSLPVIDYVGRE